ncbi:hypothetical protein Bbelb_138420 [Branchiostoma belcheri]|nr:hypothetical protein Bbelb_138420 [Branchiostoma belcheri]
MAEDDQFLAWDRVISADPTSRGLQTTYLILSLVVAVGCGLLLIYLVYRKEYLQKASNYLRCSLATYDIVFMCCLVPTEIYVLFQTDDGNSQAACWVQGLRFLVTAMGGTFLLMAVELYYFICHPLHYHQKVTTKRVVVGVLVIKGLSLLNGVGYIVLKGLQNSDTTLQCGSSTFRHHDSTGPDTAVKNILRGLNILALLLIFLPYLLLVIPYFLIFKEAKKQQERDENRNLWLYQTTAFKKLAPHAITLAVWVGAFLFLTVLGTRAVAKQAQAIFPLLVARRIVVLLYTTLSSMVNSLVYSFRMADFRRALKETFGWPSNAPVAMAPATDNRRGQDLEMAVFSVSGHGQGGSVIAVAEAPPSARLNQMGEDSSTASNTHGAGRVMQVEGTHPLATHDREANLDTIYLQDNDNPELSEMDKPTPKMAWQ